MHRTLLTPLVLAGLVLAGCGDDPGAPAPPPRDVPEAADGPVPTRVRIPRREPVALPKFDPLTDDVARGVLEDSPAAAEDIHVDARERMRYLVELGDRSAIEEIRQKLLRRVDGEYEDEYLAAMGIEILLRYGEPDAPDLAIELAERMLGEGDSFEGIAAALAAIEGPRRARAEELLLEILESDDDWAATVAAETLVTRGVRADAAFERLARDQENRVDVVRASAVAGLLKSGSPAGKTLADAMTHRDVSSAEVIDGFAIEGAVETIPYLERVVENAFLEGDATLEFVSACYALATIHGNTGDEPARELIYAWISRDPELDGEEASYALWALGDDARKAAVASVLTEHVANYESYDPELAVDILDAIAERKLANDPAFRAAVEAAAQVKMPAGADEDQALRVRILNAAGAHAFLRSK